MNKFLSPFVRFGGQVRRGDFSAISSLGRYSDLALPVGVMLLIGTFFIPLPTYVLSALLAVNLALSFVVLATSLYLRTPIELTSYPTILLITTLFRLCLSVSVTRSILGEGHAGEVIDALGRVTAGGNIIIGAVLFLVILVVQFIVVAKGSERVAEVAARFTLDALPGKQMAIDADLRAGLINQDQARQMRSSLQKESQLYGAMDGAMKFVKGDSIATIVIALINIAGGIATGVLLKHMSIVQAVQKYTILTIGDGLSAIISSMLITVSAGIVVTRVSTDEESSNVGADISQQLFTNPKPLGVAAGLLLALSVLPRMPFVPFFIAGLGLAGFAFSIMRTRKKAAEAEAERMAKAGSLASARDELEPTFTVPLAVIVSENMAHLIDKNTPTGLRFAAELPKLRSALYYDTGVMLPNVYLSKAPLKANQYSLVIKETPVAYATLHLDSVYVNDSAENIKVFGLDGEDVRNPADLKPGAWIPASQRPIADLAGLKVWEPHEVIVLHLSHIMRQYAHEFIGIQEAQAILDFTARGVPKLVEEVVPKTISVHQFTDVLQRLVQENISIRDTKSILESLSEWGRIEKDPVMLTEFVRSSLKRTITFRHTGGRDTLFVYLLDQEIEDVIRGSIRKTATGSFLSLDPAIAQDIIAAIRREVGNLPSTAQKPVVITDMELRRFVRKMVELEFPSLSVLSYQELTPELSVQPVGRITLQPEPQNFFAHTNEMASAGLLTSAAHGNG